MKAAESTKLVWLFLLAQGGWWTTKELIEGLPHSTFTSTRQRQKVSHSLRSFSNAGSVESRTRHGTRDLEFAVTPKCVTAKGITVGQVLEATGEVQP